MPAPRLAPGDIPQKAMIYILKGLRTIRYGEIVLVAQDGVLMQVEWSEKRRLDCWQESEDGENSYTESALADLAARIRRDFRLLQYGKLVLIIRCSSSAPKNSASPASTAKASDHQMSRCGWEALLLFIYGFTFLRVSPC